MSALPLLPRSRKWEFLFARGPTVCLRLRCGLVSQCVHLRQCMRLRKQEFRCVHPPVLDLLGDRLKVAADLLPGHRRERPLLPEPARHCRRRGTDQERECYAGAKAEDSPSLNHFFFVDVAVGCLDRLVHLGPGLLGDWADAIISPRGSPPCKVAALPAAAVRCSGGRAAA